MKSKKIYTYIYIQNSHAVHSIKIAILYGLKKKFKRKKNDIPRSNLELL